MSSVEARLRLFEAANTIVTGASVVTAAAIFFFVFGGVTFGVIGSADALPSYARQTGQPCGTCHTDYPSLTPFGRLFKLGGYTAGGGKYRSTLFPSQYDSTSALAAYAKKSGSDMPTKAPYDTSQINPYAPPIAMMAIVGFTHTETDQDPTGSPYNANDNVVVAPVSFFYGGAITDHIGAFAQLTYNNAAFGALDPSDPYASRLWAQDNIDVRYANTGFLGGLPITYGITANNNPSVQDPWNTTPAWSFPYAVSSVAPDPGVGTLIDGAFAAHVGSVGAYAWINNLVYLELSGYRTFSHDTQVKLGTDPFGAPGLFDGIAPYWRVAVEPHWGNHWLEFGAFGMSARVHPWTFTIDANGFYNNETFAQTDRYNDIGFDSQYQYQGSNYWITLRASYIHEKQTLDSSSINRNPDGNLSNPTNTVNTFKALASLAYGNDNKIVITGQYFDTWGSTDAAFFAGDTSGFIAEIAYIPFMASQAPGWPWANVRVGLQYTYYNKFDGDTVFAHNNNTLFAYLWFAI